MGGHKGEHIFEVCIFEIVCFLNDISQDDKQNRDNFEQDFDNIPKLLVLFNSPTLTYPNSRLQYFNTVVL